MKLFFTIALFFFFLVAVGQPINLDFIRDASLAHSQARLNRLELKNIISSHNRTAEILCEIDENKGNSYINSFHSSYLRMLNKIGNQIPNEKYKFFNRHLNFEEQNEIAKSIIEFNHSEIFKFSSDSILYPVMLIAYGRHNRFEKATRFRMGLNSENSNKKEHLDSFKSNYLVDDYISSLEIPNSSSPSINGEEFIIPFPKLPTTPTQLIKPIDLSTSQIPLASLRNLSDSMSTTHDTLTSAYSDREFQSRKIWKMDAFNEVSHKRLIDRLSTSAAPSIFRRNSLLFSSLVFQSNYQIRKGVFFGLSFSEQIRLSSLNFIAHEFLPSRDNRNFSEGFSANFRINLNNSIGFFIENQPITDLKNLKIESLYPNELIYGLKINPSSDNVVSLDLLYYQNKFSFRTNFRLKTKFFHK